MKVFPKSKRGGVVTDVVQGTGGLIIGVIIVLVIISTLLGANLFATDDRSTVRNDQTTLFVNSTGTTFGNNTLQGASCTVNTVLNETGGDVIDSGNYTVTSSTCTIAATAGVDLRWNNSTWVINSTTSYNGVTEYSVNDMNTNFTKGLDNISEKIPTILLIAAVVLLFGVLVLLVAKSREMGIGGGTSL